MELVRQNVLNDICLSSIRRHTVAAKSNARAYQIAIMGDRLRITQFFFHTNGLDYDYIVCPKYSRKLIQFD